MTPEERKQLLIEYAKSAPKGTDPFYHVMIGVYEGKLNLDLTQEELGQFGKTVSGVNLSSSVSDCRYLDPMTLNDDNRRRTSTAIVSAFLLNLCPYEQMTNRPEIDPKTNLSHTAQVCSEIVGNLTNWQQFLQQKEQKEAEERERAQRRETKVNKLMEKYQPIVNELLAMDPDRPEYYSFEVTRRRQVLLNELSPLRIVASQPGNYQGSRYESLSDYLNSVYPDRDPEVFDFAFTNQAPMKNINAIKTLPAILDRVRNDCSLEGIERLERLTNNNDQILLSEENYQLTSEETVNTVTKFISAENTPQLVEGVANEEFLRELESASRYVMTVNNHAITADEYVIDHISAKDTVTLYNIKNGKTDPPFQNYPVDILDKKANTVHYVSSPVLKEKSFQYLSSDLLISEKTKNDLIQVYYEIDKAGLFDSAVGSGEQGNKLFAFQKFMEDRTEYVTASEKLKKDTEEYQNYFRESEQEYTEYTNALPIFEKQHGKQSELYKAAEGNVRNIEKKRQSLLNAVIQSAKTSHEKNVQFNRTIASYNKALELCGERFSKMVPGNVFPRTELFPVQFRGEKTIPSAQLNGLWQIAAVLKKYNLKIEDYLKNPVYFSKKEIDREIDEVINKTHILPKTEPLGKRLAAFSWQSNSQFSAATGNYSTGRAVEAIAAFDDDPMHRKNNIFISENLNTYRNLQTYNLNECFIHCSYNESLDSLDGTQFIKNIFLYGSEIDNLAEASPIYSNPRSTENQYREYAEALSKKQTSPENELNFIKKTLTDFLKDADPAKEDIPDISAIRRDSVIAQAQNYLFDYLTAHGIDPYAKGQEKYKAFLEHPIKELKDFNKRLPEAERAGEEKYPEEYIVLGTLASTGDVPEKFSEARAAFLQQKKEDAKQDKAFAKLFAKEITLNEKAERAYENRERNPRAYRKALNNLKAVTDEINGKINAAKEKYDRLIESGRISADFAKEKIDRLNRREPEKPEMSRKDFAKQPGYQTFSKTDLDILYAEYKKAKAADDIRLIKGAVEKNLGRPIIQKNILSKERAEARKLAAESRKEQLEREKDLDRQYYPDNQPQRDEPELLAGDLNFVNEVAPEQSGQRQNPNPNQPDLNKNQNQPKLDPDQKSF